MNLTVESADSDTAGFADNCNLFEMMPPVNELEHSPLIDTERPENSMRGAPVFAEEPFCFAANCVELP